MSKLVAKEYKRFEDLALDYTKWKNFHKVMKRAMIACENYELTRYAYCLIVQNGDPRKEVIAMGQTYFAI